MDAATVSPRSSWLAALWCKLHSAAFYQCFALRSTHQQVREQQHSGSLHAAWLNADSAASFL
jgi:hypothetical protein